MPLVRTDHTYISMGLEVADAEAIGKALRCRQVQGSSRLAFKATSNELIIRLVPGQEHQATGTGFCFKLRVKIVAIPFAVCFFFGLGATRLIVPGRRSKQGDQAIAPTT